MHELAHALHYFSLAILFVFAVEIAVLIVALGLCDFMSHFFYVLDFSIVYLSIIFDLTLHGQGFKVLVFLRFWRFARVLHGWFMIIWEKGQEQEKEKTKAENEKHSNLVASLVGALHVLRSEISLHQKLVGKIKTDTDRLGPEMSVLKEHVDVLRARHTVLLSSRGGDHSLVDLITDVTALLEAHDGNEEEETGAKAVSYDMEVSVSLCEPLSAVCLCCLWCRRRHISHTHDMYMHFRPRSSPVPVSSVEIRGKLVIFRRRQSRITHERTKK